MNNRWLDKCVEKQTFIIEEWKLCRGLLPNKEYSQSETISPRVKEYSQSETISPRVKELYVALYLGDKLIAETIWDEEPIRFRPYEEQIEYLKERGFNHE